MPLISLKFYFTAIACKQRWQCLRDSYRRALNKRKEKSGQAARNIKQWKYENEMAFVVPFFMERKSQYPVENTSDDELSDNIDESHATESNASEKHNTDIEVDDTANRISIEYFQNESQERKYTEKPKAVKRKAERSEPSAPVLLMAKLLDEQNKLEPLRGYDELDRFFLNISDTVKKFSPYEQALAKNKIFSLVSEMELEQLAPPNSFPYVFNPSPQSSSTEIKYN